MRYLSRLSMLLVLGAALIHSAPGVARTLRLGTVEWEPYIGQSLDNKGYIAEVVQAAFSYSDYDIQLEFYPWARTVHLARNGSLAGYLPEYYSKELEEQFYLSEPFPGGELVFFKRKSDPISFTTLEDLKPYVFGVVRGYVNTDQFDKASYLVKEEVAHDLQNFKKLLLNRIDLVVADRYVGYHLLQSKLAEQQELIDTVDPPLERKKLYLCVGKTVEDSVEIVRSFNAGLAKLKARGLLLQLREKHGLL